MGFKIQLKKNLRITTVGIIVIFLLSISYVLYQEVKIPKYLEETVPTYSYISKSNVDYSVLLKANVLYDNLNLGEGEIYITQFVDQIQASFSYDFSGDQEEIIKEDYEIVVELEGYTIENEEIEIIWKKIFNLVPNKTIEESSEALQIREDIIFRLDDYTNFAKQVIDSSGVSSQVRLIVKMNVNTEVTTDKGTVKEESSPSMIIPLNTNYFTISGNLEEEKPGAMEETIQVLVPVNKNLITIYAILIGLSIITMIFLIFFTNAKSIDTREKQLKKLFKKHGDRLVALNSEIAITCEQYSEVHSMDDLVRIADEVGKPIMYRYSPDFKDISTMCVTDETQIYSLDVQKMFMKQTAEKKKIIKKKVKSKKQKEAEANTEE